MRIVHLSSVHSRNDTRVFIKQCRSLASHGHDVTLVVADDQGEEHKDGVRILDVGRATGRIRRMITTTQRMLDEAVGLDAAVYHLHDPELMPVGLRLRKLKKKVIFDSHEDLPRELSGKTYLGAFATRLLPQAVGWYERYACRRFNGIVTATPFLRDKFLPVNRHTIDVNNFPVIAEFDTPVAWSEKRNEVCYVGSITALRGIREAVKACESLSSPTRLNLVGRYDDPVADEIRTYAGWARVNELGWLGRAGVSDVLRRSIAGLVTLHPARHYIDSLPVKMFEYMAAGIPVIASDFPLWRTIVKRNGCGLCVDPLDPKAIADAIDYLVLNPKTARRMGENGRRAVLKKFNWAVEEEKLLGFYATLA
jgi:glycosyltransferase involved in cell wall biosynthesis